RYRIMKFRRASFWADKKRGNIGLFLFAVCILLLFPLRSEASVGPGAGFAVLSSFWTIFIAFLYSAYALLTWPFRHLLPLLKRKKSYAKAQFKRTTILSFAGMEPELAEPLMRA